MNNDIEFLIDTIGDTVLINDVARKVIITNPTIGEYEERYIHTIEPVNRGDILTISNEKYIVITESVTMRHSKYKTLARHCNYVIEIKNYKKVQTGTDSMGRPVYSDVYDYSDYIPSIVDNKTFSVNLNQSVNLAQNQIEVIVQDNTLNSTKLTVNTQYSLMDKTWKVTNQDKSKNGLIILTCELVV